MRLNKLWIHEYKNLKDVEIDFDEDQWVTVLIGWNGTGKSNVIEALTIIFRDLIFTSKKEKSDFRPPFSYRLYYTCSNKSICIHADKGKRGAKSVIIRSQAQLTASWKFDASDIDVGTNVRLSQMSDEKAGYAPQYVFGYYSGDSDRLEEVFHKYTYDFDKQLRSGKDPGLKRLFYTLPVHSNFVLLAFILQNEKVVNDFLVKELGLDPESGIDSVLFVLQQPSWKSTDGDSRFWYARGVVRDFLSKLYEVSIAPVRTTRKVPSSLWNKKGREFLHLYVKDLSTLRELAKGQSPREFFRDLESTYVSELIEEVRIRVRLKKNDGSVTFRELSEGEQQLLTVLGLLRFTAEQESLFLLDEPDTHLNPRWAVDYLNYLKKFATSDDNKSSKNNHILLTTHNPLAIAELEKRQVRILKRDEDDLKISSLEPEEDPRGLGYAGIVTSDMFGISTSLDKPTQDLLEQQRAYGSCDTLTSTQQISLNSINAKLDRLGFRFSHPDDEYSRYLRLRNAALAERFHSQQPESIADQSASLTREERENLAARLVAELIEEEETAGKDT